MHHASQQTANSIAAAGLFRASDLNSAIADVLNLLPPISIFLWSLNVALFALELRARLSGGQLTSLHTLHYARAQSLFVLRFICACK